MTPRERLTIVAEILEARPEDDEHFDIRVFVSHRPCGTVACALGWAAMDPRLNDDGFGLHPGNVPLWNQGTNLKFFDLEPHVYQSIFYSDGYENFPGPHDVARKIRGVLAT